MRASQPSQPHADALMCVNANAAGLDIGSEEIWACVPADRDPQPVRPFGTFTPDLYALADWLAPRHEISGGKVLRRGTLKTGNRAGQALRLAAYAVSRSRSALGAYYRRMRARLGPKAAIVATAHKIARIVYHMLKHRTPYRDLSPEDYAQQARERDIANLRKKAAKLGFALVDVPA